MTNILYFENDQIQFINISSSTVSVRYQSKYSDIDLKKLSKKACLPHAYTFIFASCLTPESERILL